MANVLLRAVAFVVAAFALALVYMRLPEAVARADRPLCERCNVILISFDTVRADHIGAYGYKERPTTPNVDRLAERSVVFERAISQAPWTLPSHASMLSGLYPSRLGVLRYPATRVLSEQYTTLPEAFRTAGYATAGFTGGGFVSEHYGFNRGFDVYATRGRRYEHNIDATIDWLDEHKRSPFFLFFHGYDAHRPYYSKSVDKTAMGLPEGIDAEQPKYCLRDDREDTNSDRREKILRYYDASIHHGDRAIGVLLDALEKMHLMENTVILLTSDHGEEFFEHGHCDHVRFLYNESLHVPYMVYFPSLAVGGRRVPGLIPASISVARTLLDMVGIDHAMPGATVLPLLEGKQKAFPVVYSEADSPVGQLSSRGRAIAITKNELKLISYTDEGTDEAFNLLEDPGEQNPLPERNPAYLMRQTLRSWADALRPLPKPPREMDDEAKAAAMDDEDSTGNGGEESPDGGTSDGSKPKGAKPKPKKDQMPEELKKDLKSLGYLQ